MQTELIADSIVKNLLKAEREQGRLRIASALFSPVPVDRRAIKRPLRELVKASCPVSFKGKLISEVEHAVIDALKNYGIKVSKR